VLAVMAENGLARGETACKVYVMGEIRPSHPQRRIRERSDGLLHRLTSDQLTLGVDRDWANWPTCSAKPTRAVIWMIET